MNRSADLRPLTRREKFDLALDFRTLLQWLETGGYDTIAGRDTYTDELDGYPSTASGAGDAVSGGDVTSSTERQALALVEPDGGRRDFIRERHLEIVDGIREAAAQARRAMRSASRALHTPTTDTRAGMDYCRACGRWVPGTDADRIRSGYCEADYKRWLRAGRPDRAGFEAATPNAVDATEEVPHG